MKPPRFSRGRIVVIAVIIGVLSSGFVYANHRFRAPPDDLALREPVEWGLPVGSAELSDETLHAMADALAWCS